MHLFMKRGVKFQYCITKINVEPELILQVHQYFNMNNNESSPL